MLDSTNVWFITGCSSGLGKSLATTVHQAGHKLVATARNINSLSYLPDEPNVLKLSLDVTSQDDIKSSFDKAVEKFGQIDIVINNAGYVVMGDTEAIPESDARLEMETVFWGPVRITLEAARVFREVNPAGRGGTVIQVSSIGGYITFPGSSFYHAGKHAIGGFTQSFAKELDPSWNIKFMVVAPGGLKTNFPANAQLGGRHPAYDYPTSPLNQLMEFMMNPDIQKTFAEPDDCAKVLFDVVVAQDERKLPTRFLMGAETVPIFEAEYKKDAAEMEDWKEETLKCTQNEGVKDIPGF
ncbi:uncharacterized protein N7483_000338 [Penicillium malachiteum]|uniref:uncharacterized protein n=1 Tax=Penicillium malachiteum TaxID=1324776 RepID=UPI0025480A65|nr:uncharacterized protein N7483_000338 [Penicillium malachiteum]KAJ5735213.1 hypothetical protein N7483_000338 [Penicillium malachiteum]